MTKKVVIVGAGFAGLEAAKAVAQSKNMEVVVIDRRNYHLFQPLLYQVAMAGLNAADIAEPIRSIFSKQKNVTVYQGAVEQVLASENKIITDFGDINYDYLVLACGAMHHYYGNDEWEKFAPGLKTLSQATEIRLRVLSAFEEAEKSNDPETRRKHLTFVIVGGGPTGVELAGAIGEMSRFTLRSDFRNINPSDARIILVNAGDLVLNTFAPDLSKHAMRSLESLGVEIIVNKHASNLSSEGLDIGDTFYPASTILWAAGVTPSPIGKDSKLPIDRGGRILTNADLSVQGHSNIFAAGDLANVVKNEHPLPGVASVAMQEGRYVGKVILADAQNKKRPVFNYFDKGSIATIGRSKAIMQSGPIKLWGWGAWIVWLFVHIVYLVRYKNRFFTIFQWGVSYFFYRRGARLIIRKEWHRRKQDIK